MTLPTGSGTTTSPPAASGERGLGPLMPMADSLNTPN
jgi:hypothetical protein